MMIYENDFTQLAYLLYRTIEGDDILEECDRFLKRYKFVDEYGEWIHENE